MLIGNEVYLGVNRLKSQQVSYTVLRLQIGTNCIVDLEKNISAVSRITSQEQKFSRNK
jgi:hypothetical protein